MFIPQALLYWAWLTSPSSHTHTHTRRSPDIFRVFARSQSVSLIRSGWISSGAREAWRRAPVVCRCSIIIWMIKLWSFQCWSFSWSTAGYFWCVPAGFSTQAAVGGDCRLTASSSWLTSCVFVFLSGERVSSGVPWSRPARVHDFQPWKVRL